MMPNCCLQNFKIEFFLEDIEFKEYLEYYTLLKRYMAMGGRNFWIHAVCLENATIVCKTNEERVKMIQCYNDLKKIIEADYSVKSSKKNNKFLVRFKK